MDAGMQRLMAIWSQSLLHTMRTNQFIQAQPLILFGKMLIKLKRIVWEILSDSFDDGITISAESDWLAGCAVPVSTVHVYCNFMCRNEEMKQEVKCYCFNFETVERRSGKRKFAIVFSFVSVEFQPEIHGCGWQSPAQGTYLRSIVSFFFIFFWSRNEQMHANVS